MNPKQDKQKKKNTPKLRPNQHLNPEMKKSLQQAQDKTYYIRENSGQQ